MRTDSSVAPSTASRSSSIGNRVSPTTTSVEPSIAPTLSTTVPAIELATGSRPPSVRPDSTAAMTALNDAHGTAIADSPHIATIAASLNAPGSPW